MLLQYSYHNRKIKRQVEELVGKPYSIIQRLKMNGNGSQRLSVVSANDELVKILTTTSNTDPYINIELRPKGIIVHFRIRLDNWALILPYYSLSIFSQENQLKLYSGEWKIQLTGYRQAPVDRKFVQKALKLKAESAQEPV